MGAVSTSVLWIWNSSLSSLRNATYGKTLEEVPLAQRLQWLGPSGVGTVRSAHCP